MNRYLEDVIVGEQHRAGPIEVNQAECLAFSRAYDPQPMHLDPETAGPRFGGVIASGWFTAALAMRLLTDARLLGDSDVLGLGVADLRWPLPVRPGDTLSVEIEALSVTPSKSNPRFGVVKFGVTTRNQRGEIVMTHAPSCWVPRRP